MILLAVDTSGATGSMALARIDDGQKIASLTEVSWIKKAMHSEIATLKLQELLNSAGVDLKQLTHLTVNIGPGSFTGLRVGISLVKTLAYSLALPVAPVNRLEVLALKNGAAEKNIFVAVKALREFFYTAGFTRSALGLMETLAPASTAQLELAKVSADYTKVLIESETPSFSTETEAKDLVSLLLDYKLTRHFLDWKCVEPLYIRGSEAEEKLKRGPFKT